MGILLENLFREKCPMPVKSLFLLALVLVSGSVPAQTASLDFSQARLIAHERVDAIKVEKAETDRRRSEAQSARSLHGPRIELDAKQIWGEKTIDFGSINLGSAASSLLPPGSALGPALSQLRPLDLYYEDDIGGPRAAITAELPIYMGGAINAKIRAADEAVYESQARTQAKRDTIDVELATKYFAVQLARSVERLQEEMLDQQGRELKRAQRFEKAGTISRLERMAVEVNRDAARRDLLTAQTNRRVAESELAGLLREPSVGELKTPLFVVTDNIGTLESWQQKALAASPLLKSVQAGERMAREGVTAAKAAWQPKVYAFANYNLIKHYLTIPEPDWIAGIGVKFTLWDNKDRNAGIAAARSLVTKAQAAHAEASNTIRTQVEKAYLQSSREREAYRLTDSTLALAKENLRLREKSFAEGLSTADDVNDARTKLLAAQVARRVAAYRFVVAWAMLNAVAGDMNAFEASAQRKTNIFEQ